MQYRVLAHPVLVVLFLDWINNALGVVSSKMDSHNPIASRPCDWTMELADAPPKAAAQIDSYRRDETARVPPPAARLAAAAREPAGERLLHFTGWRRGRRESGGLSAQGKHLQLEHEASNHGDVARFRVAFQQNVAGQDYVHPVDDLVNRSSKRAKERTLKEGVPHEEVNVALLLPTTYMNCSGTAVRAFMQSHRWRLKKNPLALNRQDELLVVTDDVALPFGECRFKAKGGPGGQNGVRDIIKCVGTERFARLRIGLGAPHWFVGGNSGAPSGTAMDKFVLGRFNGDEQEAMPDLLSYTNELLRLYLHRGVAQATTYANSMDLERYLKQYSTSRPSRR
ncbi:unnamed protein product [Phytophthora fragariaefolia]|uniref:Unnamed protein product n=1 Tax=Phytophthora fragariaefolia TaxID=1490495 RepID=A0A9W6WXU2_9STRA|nr:unnamed protein product [Phytophthora fragariaefolia]